MKRYAIPPYDAGAFFTAGQRYPIIEWRLPGVLFEVKDNFHEIAICRVTNCAFLEGGNWQIVEEEE